MRAYGIYASMTPAAGRKMRHLSKIRNWKRVPRKLRWKRPVRPQRVELCTGTKLVLLEYTRNPFSQAFRRDAQRPTT